MHGTDDRYERNVRLGRTFAQTVAAVLAAVAIGAWAIAMADGLPPGQHTATPKYWPRLGWHVANYTPFQFDGRVRSLTAGTNGDIWFGVGSSLEHIDSHRNMSVTRMPYSQWTVSGISVVGKDVWFSAGQSGKLGILDGTGNLRFVQAVPRRFNPDIWDVIANNDGEAWFVDYGRLSIGYRSATGRLVENPFPPEANPIRLAHCMGRLWVVAVMSANTSSGLFTLDDDLRPQPFFLDLPRGYTVRDISCDRSDRLWMIESDYTSASVIRFDGGGNFKRLTIGQAGGGSLTPDLAGGLWVTPAVRAYLGVLLHVGPDMALMRRVLPAEIEDGDPVLADSDSRLWIAVNGGGFPIAVTELDTR